jgi:hypothetical protein
VLLLLEPSGFDLHHELQLAQADSGTSQPPNCVGQLILIINLVCERVCVCVYCTGSMSLEKPELNNLMLLYKGGRGEPQSTWHCPYILWFSFQSGSEKWIPSSSRPCAGMLGLKRWWFTEDSQVGGFCGAEFQMETRSIAKTTSSGSGYTSNSNSYFTTHL